MSAAIRSAAHCYSPQSVGNETHWNDSQRTYYLVSYRERPQLYEIARQPAGHLTNLQRSCSEVWWALPHVMLCNHKVQMLSRVIQQNNFPWAFERSLWKCSHEHYNESLWWSKCWQQRRVNRMYHRVFAMDESCGRSAKSTMWNRGMGAKYFWTGRQNIQEIVVWPGCSINQSIQSTKRKRTSGIVGYTAAWHCSSEYFCERFHPALSRKFMI